MKYLARLAAAVMDFGSRDTIVQFHVSGDARAELERFKGVELELTIKKFQPKRSIDSNNYAWLLMDKIAKAMHSTKEEVYLIMLERYGTFFYIPCEEDKMDNIKQVFRIVKDRGIEVLTTETGDYMIYHQLQCYKGSSLMNREEMAIFLDGIVSEAKELSIETETPEMIERMKVAWEVEYGKAKNTQLITADRT